MCSQIAAYCSTKWPPKNPLSQSIFPYLPMASEFTIVNGLLMRGRRIVIPSSMRSEMLEKLHQGHQGVTKCHERARQLVWWPGLAKQLEDCQELQRMFPAPISESRTPCSFSTSLVAFSKGRSRSLRVEKAHVPSTDRLLLKVYRDCQAK